MSEYPKRARFIGIRCREVDEQCPMCDDPGSGMLLDTYGMDHVDESWQWTCTRCVKRYNERSTLSGQV